MPCCCAKESAFNTQRCLSTCCSARFKDDLLPHLENKRVEVMWADDRVAALWANSDAAKAEFPDYSFLVSARAMA